MTTTLELKPIPTDDVTPKAAPPAGTTVVDIVQRLLDNDEPNVATITATYLKLRNAKKDIDNQAKERTAPIAQAMDMIEGFLLDRMNAMGVDSLKNEAGTPYKSERVSVTIADSQAFLDNVLDRALQALPIKPEAREAIKNAMLESGQLALLEVRPSKSAVEALLEETQELPPGLNRRVEATVNVRSA